MRTDEEKALYEALSAMVEIANRRWRSLPPDSHEKKVLAQARAALGKSAGNRR